MIISEIEPGNRSEKEAPSAPLFLRLSFSPIIILILSQAVIVNFIAFISSKFPLWFPSEQMLDQGDIPLLVLQHLEMPAHPWFPVRTVLTVWNPGSDRQASSKGQCGFFCPHLVFSSNLLCAMESSYSYDLLSPAGGWGVELIYGHLKWSQTSNILIKAPEGFLQWTLIEDGDWSLSTVWNISTEALFFLACGGK